MDDVVMVPIPVSAKAAKALADERRRASVGKLVSDMLEPAAGTDPLALIVRAVKADARADGLTDDEIDAELAAYNAEHRLRR